MAALQGDQCGSWRTGAGAEIRAVVGVHHRVLDLQISYSLWSRRPPEGHDRRRFNLAYASMRKEDMTGRWLDPRAAGARHHESRQILGMIWKHSGCFCSSGLGEGKRSRGTPKIFGLRVWKEMLLMRKERHLSCLPKSGLRSFWGKSLQKCSSIKT